MRRLPLALLALAVQAVAGEPAPRPSARLLLEHPDAFAPGRCLRYEEGGAGWILTEPVYYLQGAVLAAEVRARTPPVCPAAPGKQPGQYTREEYVRLAAAQPCAAPGSPARDERIGIVRLRAAEWETPHARRAENAGRLYRGMFLDQPLREGAEIELEADLLGPCDR